MAGRPSASLTCSPAGPEFAISEDAAMPTIKVKAVLRDMPSDAKGAMPTYEWKAALTWNGKGCLHALGRVISHPDMTRAGRDDTFTVPFAAVRGGDLVVTVTIRRGDLTMTARSERLKVVGANPSVVKLATTVPVRQGFRKLMRLESALRQFRGPGCPLFSADSQGGVGLCQITRPAPTDEQVWNWKANVAAGWALYQEKEAAARRYPAHVRESPDFKALVKAYNDKRLAANAVPRPAERAGAAPSVLRALQIDLPDYTDEQLERDTLRGFNGYAGGLHEYRPEKDEDGMLVVTPDAGAAKGAVAWERLSAADRTAHYDNVGIAANRRGDVNYVDDVEAEATF